ncbi:DMT family transporter [Microbacterium album]|uniref:Membrane protein n=1 Tax=Microbacterium album TaxID=2053191 RepID=A0A917IH26_9MICO|nr:EamA family transporter [Microbacterium album]GGH43235.1 membrane protein [Microbacterium album]
MPSSRFTARGWVLFAIMSVVWGVTYLLIRESVHSFSPPAVVAIRTLGAALVLLPFALKQDALRPALRKWRWVLAFGLVEMAGPFLLLAHAEQSIPSGLTGLLVATVPLFATLIGLARGERGALRPMRAIGLALGFAGVAIVALSGAAGPEPNAFAIGEVLLVAVLYATAPFIVARHLPDVPSLGVITLSLGVIGIAYVPAAILTTHEPPTGRSIAAIALLTVVCTALAFIAFFALIAEVGPVRAPLFTYVNPVVAVALGVLLVGEPLTVGLLIGFPVVLLGCLLAAGGLPGRVKAVPDAVVSEEPDPLVGGRPAQRRG